MKKTLLALTALFVLSLSSLAAEPPSAPGDLAVPPAQHAIFFRPRGFRPRGTALAAACATRNLPYRGGPVIPSAKVVYIFWGPSFNNASSADYQYARELIAFRNLLGGTPEYNVITQYSQAGGIFSQFIQRANLAAGTADWFDTSTPPTNVTDALVQREVQTYLASHPFDSSTVYEVFIPSSSYSSFSSSSTSCGGPALSYCAYHSSYGSGANAVKYSIQPYPSCGSCQAPGFTAAQNQEHFVVHETRETVTDPLANAWSYPCGSDTIEADDQCAWTPAPFIGSGGYGYQYEWSNEVGGCVQTHPIGPPFTISFNPPNQTVVYPGFLSQMDVSYSVSFQGGQSGDVFLQLSQDFCTTGEVYSLSQNHFTSSGSGTFSIWIFDPSTTGGGNGYYQCYQLMGVQDGVSHIVETDIFVSN